MNYTDKVYKGILKKKRYKEIAKELGLSKNGVKEIAKELKIHKEYKRIQNTKKLAKLGLLTSLVTPFLFLGL